MANIVIDGTTYSGIEEVYLPNVGGVEDQFTLPPSGSIPINSNGTVDVSAYQYANVNVSSEQPETQEKTATPSESIVEVTPDSGKLLSKVTINAISASYIGSGVTQKSEQTYTPGTSNQTINAGQYLSGTQTISGDADLVASNIKNGVSIFGVTGTYTGSGAILQSKTVNPTTSQQTVNPDSGYDGLSQVTVNAIQTETKSATPSETAQIIIPTSGKYLTSVSIGAISGTYVGSGVTKKNAQTYMPSTTDQTINANQYLSGAQTVKGDVNLIPANIAKDVSIFGVTGTHEGGGEATITLKYWP